MGRIRQCFAGCIGSEMNHVGCFVLFARSKYYFQIWLNNDICRFLFAQRQILITIAQHAYNFQRKSFRKTPSHFELTSLSSFLRSSLKFPTILSTHSSFFEAFSKETLF